MMLRCAMIGVAVVLYGCGAGPGAPLIRHSPDDGQGVLLSRCQNISRTDKTDKFITEYYLTTWGSAAREGAAVGFEKGLQAMAGTGMDAVLSAWGYSQLPESAIYCRKYRAKPQHVLDVTAKRLKSIGYRLVSVNKRRGEIETDFYHRKRSLVENGPPLHKWKDRFVVTVKPFGEAESAVHVFRDIHISRCDRKDGCSDFVRATSVGHNEAAILNFIDQDLR